LNQGVTADKEPDPVIEYPNVATTDQLKFQTDNTPAPVIEHQNVTTDTLVYILGG
jgi:hypothetical protein